MYGLPDEVVLAVKGLSVELPHGSARKNAVKNITFELFKDEALCIIGESGSGKSVMVQAILQLLPKQFPTSGSVIFKGERLDRMRGKEIRAIRGKNISIIFQDSVSYLNQNMTIRAQMREIFEAHNRLDWFEERTETVIKEVGLDKENILDRYPFELSGGQRQRIMIAMAMCLKPDIIIADESTTAIDPINQKNFINLIKNLKFKYGISFIFITHDISLAYELADRIMVLNNGNIAEIDQAKTIFENPASIHTKKLLAAVKKIKSTTSVSKEVLLEVNNISKSYVSRKLFFPPVEKQVLNEINLKIYKNEILGLVGQNGVGKSTLAKLVCKLLAQNSGSITFDGQDINDIKENYHLLVQKIFQNASSSLNPKKTIKELILQGLIINNFSEEAKKNKLEELVELIKIPRPYLSMYPYELSLGNQQRISIARALALEPRLLIADEPIASLDSVAQLNILELFHHLRQKAGLSVMFISHNMRAIYQLCDRVAVMSEGQVVEVGTPKEIFTEPKQSITRELVEAVPGKKVFVL